MAGKFGNVARDSKQDQSFLHSSRAHSDTDTVTVTVTSFPETCTLVPQELAIQQASIALSEASAAIAQVAGGTAVTTILPPAASAALSEASAFLSSLAASPLAPLPVSANATVGPGPSTPGYASAPGSSLAINTSPVQVTTPGSPSATNSISQGAAAEGRNFKGFCLMVLTGLLGNIALMV